MALQSLEKSEMGDAEFDQNAAAEAAANATAAQLKDKYDPALVRAYIAEKRVYDKRADHIREQAKDNRVGRGSMRKKYETLGLDTEGVDDILEAYLAMRQSGVPSDRLTPLFNEISGAMDGPVAGITAEPPAEEPADDYGDEMR